MILARRLLWAGSIGGIVMFAGDMLFYGRWGAGNESFGMAGTAAWRLYLGSMAGPLGGALYLMGVVGAWLFSRTQAPRLANTMLACLGGMSVIAVLQHGLFGPLGFALQHGGANGSDVVAIRRLNGFLSVGIGAIGLVGFSIWIFLTLSQKVALPRWTVFTCPFVTGFLSPVARGLPAPLGVPVVGGFTNIAFFCWFLVLALTWRSALSNGDRYRT
jgi:uncharacterized protein DUF6796